jgi:ABC-2 type transport system permease protein
MNTVADDMRLALRSEWTKLRTVRSTAWLSPGAAMLFVALSVAISAAATPDTTACADGCDPARLALSGVYSAQVAVVVLAVLAVTSEYDTGVITVTLAATPRRLAVLAAKAAAVVAMVVPVGLLGVTASLSTGRMLLSANGFPSPLPAEPTTALRAGAGTVLYLVLVALLSLGVGAALRHTAPALTAALALLYLAPMVARIIPDDRWQTRIERYAPMSAGLAIQSTRDVEQLPIGPLAGLAVLTGYAAAALAVGAAVFTTRDL